jgi:hypothetical protein
VRVVLLVIAVALATAGVACAGDDDELAEPLTLEQRVLHESDVPGSKPDPVETRETASNLDQFEALGGHVVAAEIPRDKLQEAGFVSAIQDTRFFPKAAGGPHTRDARHVRVVVLQFESEDGAVSGIDLLQGNSLKPCPGECATRVEEFEVSEVPDARGARSFATAEEVEAVGDGGPPFDSYIIWFSDGRFAYEVSGFGPPGAVSKAEIEEIAKKLRDRVEDAPPPET